jgi:YD repeat-containing protein
MRTIVAKYLAVLLIGISATVVLQGQSAPVNYVYDELGRLVAVIDGTGASAVYVYDAVGNLTAIGRYTSGTVSILEFTPSDGPNGTTVTIYGTGFSSTPSQNTVTFNGVAATVTSSTANSSSRHINLARRDAHSSSSCGSLEVCWSVANLMV